MTCSPRRIAAVVVLALGVAVPGTARAQEPAGGADFSLAALPTTLGMPSHKWAFHLTHRFSRPIAEGSASDFFADFLGFDSAAKIGFELRFGLTSRTQLAIHRTNDRAIQLLAQHTLLSQGDSSPLSVDAIVAVDGQNNFGEAFSTTVGGVIMRAFGDRGAVYVHPYGVLHLFDTATNPPPAGPLARRNTFVTGLGVRWRLGASSTYLVAEVAPRVAGYREGNHHASFGIEHGVGGHMFQFNISNTFGTTLAQVARGGRGRDDWYIGFNLSRRFY